MMMVRDGVVMGSRHHHTAGAVTKGMWRQTRRLRSYKTTQCKYIKNTNTKESTKKYKGIRSDEGYYNHAIQYYTPPKNINRFIQTL